jgi:hypothetical protein
MAKLAMTLKTRVATMTFSLLALGAQVSLLVRGRNCGAHGLTLSRALLRGVEDGDSGCVFALERAKGSVTYTYARSILPHKRFRASVKKDR